MKRHPFLEVTYRKGKPFAGYLNLRKPPEGSPCRTEEIRPGILIDLAPDGLPVGIEFLSPGRVTAHDIDAIRRYLREEDLPAEDLAPIMAK